MLLQKQKTTIGFRELSIFCRVGVLPRELEKPQQILVTLEVDVELTLMSDRLEETVDYVALMNLCKHIANEKHYMLLETLAAHILTALERDFPIQRAQITLEKPAFSTFVKMERVFS